MSDPAGEGERHVLSDDARALVEELRAALGEVQTTLDAMRALLDDALGSGDTP